MDTQEPSYALIGDQDKADERRAQQENQPGIIIFRHKMRSDRRELQPSEIFGEGLVVFVVGEEPTQGIHREQFKNAAAWIAALQPDANAKTAPYKLPKEGILGPTFFRRTALTGRTAERDPEKHRNRSAADL